jgi:DNA-binding beta-propeller fold protein YncE
LRWFSILLAWVLAFPDAMTAARSQTTFPLRTIADVPLSGGSSRMDYESLDPQAHLLFIAHMGAGQVIAFDVAHRRVIATIGGTRTVRGVLVVPRLHRVYAAAEGDHEVVVIDERTLHVVARVRGAGDVDGLAFDPATNRVFVSDETGGNDVVIDARTNRLVGRIGLGGEAGNTEYDAGSGYIVVAVQTRNQLVEIDPRRMVVRARYELTGCEHGHGVAIDAIRRTAYIACEYNDTLVQFDLRRHRVVDRANVGHGPDVLSIDAALHRLYVASESGTVSVFDIRGPRLVKLGEAVFAAHAHVVAVDPGSHEVFFPLENVGGKPVLRIATPR